MTRKISLITASVGAALVLGVPAAWGDNSRADQQEQAVRVSPDLVDMLVSKNGVVDASVVDGLNQSNTHDGLDRATFERAAPPAGTAYVAAVSSGSGIAWLQIGIGFVVGNLLALGLVLGLRYTRVRPLAH